VVSNDIRNQLILLAGSKKTRSALFTAARPTVWGPLEVRRPDTGEAFTPDGAWTFIVELLKAGTEVETMVLDKPPGKTGYVIKCDGWDGEKIYIKLQLGSGCVYGRSFHVSRTKI
jgi:hypothetical protein